MLEKSIESVKFNQEQISEIIISDTITHFEHGIELCYVPEQEIKESSPKVLLKPLDNDFLMRLTSVIEENLASKDLDVVFLSHKMCMSQSTLYRKLKGLINISTNEYIRKIRIKKAIELLDSDKYKVTEVMWEVGMSSAVYFRQCFKEELGVFPSEYLKIKDKIVTEKSDTTNNRKFKQICIG